MLIQLSDDIRAYVYQVFVVRMDAWVVFGLAAQVVFACRFVVQWIASERAGRSVVPTSFWLISIVGGLMTLAYGFKRREPVLIVGQLLASAIYLRNLALILRERRSARASTRERS